MSKVSVAEVNAFYADQFSGRGAQEAVVSLEDGFARLRRTISEAERRPGGYVSGPTQMGLADSAAYAAIFTRIGIVPMAVTSNLNINFLRPCIGEAVIADATLIKCGKTLAVIEVEIRAEGSDKVSSHAVINYSIPLG